MAFALKKSSKASDGDTPKPSGKAMKRGKSRKQQFMLFVGDEGAILIYMEGDTVVRRLFAPTANIEHTRTMTELMQQHPKAPVSMLFDVIDQQYIRHTFPPVSPLSVEGLVRRRLERDFAAEDLRGSIRLGREGTARKDWLYLLIALSNTANFQQWVELIVEQPNHLMGAFLLPVECQNIIPLLASCTPNRPQVTVAWQMLISHHKVSGFRIVVLRDGKLSFTRVSQAIGEAVPAVIAGNVEQEIQNTIEYIRRLGYTEATGLEIYAILAAEVRDSIDTKRINAAAINLLSPIDVADALELNQAALAADRFGDVVMASSFALAGKPALRLYPAYAQKLDQLFKAKIGVRAGGALLSLLMLFMTGNAVLNAFGARSEAQTARASIAREEPTLALLKTQVEKLGEAVNFKNDVAAFYEKMKPTELSPVAAIDEVAKLKRPNIRLDEWEWSTASNLPNADGTLAAPVAAAPAADGTAAPPAGPVSIKVKAVMLDSFPDNETIIAAVDAYKQYLTGALTKYAFSIGNSEFASDSTGKISVALSGESGAASPTGDGSGATQSPTLEVLLTGPKPELPADPAAAPAPTPGVQP